MSLDQEAAMRQGEPSEAERVVLEQQESAKRDEQWVADNLSRISEILVYAQTHGSLRTQLRYGARGKLVLAAYGLTR